jgi:type II secretory pathway pseudopilin PulG
MPVLRMNLTRQSQLVNNQIQQAQQIQQIQQAQSLFRLGSTSNRNMMPLLITGNKSCQSCGGK